LGWDGAIYEVYTINYHPGYSIYMMCECETVIHNIVYAGGSGRRGRANDMQKADLVLRREWPDVAKALQPAEFIGPGLLALAGHTVDEFLGRVKMPAA
jgi:hypothetical protein